MAEEDVKTDAQAWQNRAPLWELLALSFRYPEEALVGAVTSGEWTDAAQEIAAVNGLALPEGFAADANAAKGEDPDTFIHTLRQEATRLFVGPGDPVASPYEAVWRAKAEGVQPLLFVNPHTMDVERFCKACGLGSPKGKNEPLDHVATECELLEYLCLKAAEAEAGNSTGAEGNAEATSGENASGDAAAPKDPTFPDGSPEAAYAKFLADHLAVWANDFCDTVAAETRLPFYRAAAALLKAAVG